MSREFCPMFGCAAFVIAMVGAEIGAATFVGSSLAGLAGVVPLSWLMLQSQPHPRIESQ